MSDERLEREEGGDFGAGARLVPEPKPSSLPLQRLAAGTEESFEAAVKARTQSDEFRALIARMSKGEEPYGRALLPLEVQKFGPQHVQVVMLRLGGFRGTEIATLVGWEPNYVNTVLRHPYAQKIIQFLLPSAVTDALDMKAKLQTYANTLVDKLFDVAMKDDTKPEVVTRIGFGILDRAGYAPVHKTVSKHDHRIKLPSESAQQLSKALDLSRQSREVPAQYTVATRPAKSDVDSETETPPASAGVSGGTSALQDPSSSRAVA